MFFSMNATTSNEIYTLSLHDALPIFGDVEDAQTGVEIGQEAKILVVQQHVLILMLMLIVRAKAAALLAEIRSEEHTSELQSRRDLVCRLLLEKKKKRIRHEDGCCLDR